MVPNTNRHATEGSNPIWMTGVGYDNWGLQDNEEEEDEEEAHNRGGREVYDTYDSLDTNVLNDSYNQVL